MKEIRDDFLDFLERKAEKILATVQMSHSSKKVEHLKKLIEFLKKFIENFDKFSQKEISYKDFCSNFHVLKKNLTLEKVRKNMFFLKNQYFLGVRSGDFRTDFQGFIRKCQKF